MQILISGVSMLHLRGKINDAIHNTQYAEQVSDADICVATTTYEGGVTYTGRIYCTYLGTPNRDKTEDIAKDLANALRKIKGLSPEHNRCLAIRSYTGETNEITFTFEIVKVQEKCLDKD